MKTFLFVLSAVALFCACQKEESHEQNSPPPDVTGKRLVGMRGYVNNGLIRRDTFMYSSDGKLLTQKQFSWQTNPSTPDSITVNFNYNGSGDDPASYTLIDGYGAITYTQSYDAQGRIKSDTTIPDIAQKACTFSYSNGNIIQSSVNNGSLDTFYITNKNIVQIMQSDLPYDASSVDRTFFTYTPALPNPFATVCQTMNLRILLSKIDAWEIYFNDYVSENIYTSIRDAGVVYPYTYTTDGSGKVIRGTISQGGTTVAYDYIYEK